MTRKVYTVTEEDLKAFHDRPTLRGKKFYHVRRDATNKIIKAELDEYKLLKLMGVVRPIHVHNTVVHSESMFAIGEVNSLVLYHKRLGEVMKDIKRWGRHCYIDEKLGPMTVFLHW